MPEAKVWTVEDTRRMLRGQAAQEAGSGYLSLSPGAVSLTVETAVEQPRQPTETARVVPPLVPKRRR